MKLNYKNANVGTDELYLNSKNNKNNQRDFIERN
jgi:hypothetical protein